MSPRRDLNTPSQDPRCRCGYPLSRYWPYCPDCGRAQKWNDQSAITGDRCPNCSWEISPKFLYCPWCATMVYNERTSAHKPLKAPKGFRMDARCDWGCGGGVQYPMPYCPWCSRPQWWNEDAKFEGECPHCDRGVDDWMDHCPWCGEDSTGRDLIDKVLVQVRTLLNKSGIPDWGYRVLLRPGVSGVDPKYPKIVEIEQKYVTRARRQDEIPWSMLVGLVAHELGHSFLYHHWHWTQTRAFKLTFGEATKAYRINDDAWVDFQRRRIGIRPVNHVSGYAARHPQEDFAETFRYYVTRRGRLRELFAELGQKRKGLPVYEKFLVLHDYVRLMKEWRR